ncbi:pectin lyase fold/virulence factor [Vibrio phage 1.110.O._10N.261.52.C1]|nr:pectin lyase fold/virulence factor [Vibrio phage 1.110.O._10N.261.52.C1]
MADCSSYPTKSTAETFKLDAETVNEVVTSSDDRTPPASDGLTKKTLAGIETDATNQLADIQQRADDQYSDINNQYVLRNKGDYATDPLLESYYEFADFNGLIYFPIVAPYQVDSATYPDPSNDLNLRLGQATDDSLVTSTGSTTPRTLADRFSDVVNIKDFGAVEGQNIASYLNSALAAGYTNILVKGNYLFEGGTINVVSPETKIEFDGLMTVKAGTNTRFSNPDFYDLAHTAVPSYRGMALSVSDATNVAVGDIIRITTTTVGETGWNYMRQFTSTVSSVDGTTITLSRSSTFNLNAGDITGLAVRVYKSKQVEINGLNIETESACGNADGITLSELIVTMQDVTQNNHYPSAAYTVRASYCCDSTITNIKVKGGLYPFLLAACSNITVENVTAHDCHHAIATGDFCDGVYVNNIQGTGGLLESHPSFDVHYSNFTVVTGTGNRDTEVNLRSVGGSLTNGRVTSHNLTGIAYIQNVALTDEEPYQTDCNFVMDNIIWETTQDREFQCNIEKGYEVRVTNSKFCDNLIFGGPATANDIAGGVYVHGVNATKIQVRGEVFTHDKYSLITDGTYTGSGNDYEVDIRSAGVDRFGYKVSGRLPITQGPWVDGDILNLKIYFGTEYNTSDRYCQYRLKVSTVVKHSSAGVLQYREADHLIHVKVVSASSIAVSPNSITELEPSGFASDSGTMSLGAFTFGDFTTDDRWFSVPVEISSGGRADPELHQVRYSLELINRYS